MKKLYDESISRKPDVSSFISNEEQYKDQKILIEISNKVNRRAVDLLKKI